MERVKRFEDLVGGTWVTVKFHRTVPSERELISDEEMRFCEAVRRGRESPVILTPPQMTCPGALRSFGWGRNRDAEMAGKISEKLGISRETASAMLKETPRVERGIGAVTVGDCERPDLVISYAQPLAAMRLMRQFQKISGENLPADLSSIVSVCGHVAVKCFLTGRICLSLGCNDAREYGAISRDRLVIGVPYDLIQRLI